MKRMVMIFGVLVALRVAGAPISPEVAVERGLEWMAGNPVMEAAAGRPVASVEVFPDLGTGYSVYVVGLDPVGYLVLNSDDRLSLVVCFSVNSGVDLSDVPDNAFRSMLLRHVARMEETLAEPALPPAKKQFATRKVTELYGPFLETAWNQCNPYNKLCPDNPSGDEYYDYRAAVGCVPVVYAQILGFHRWPYFGEGAHAYTDSWGSMTGAHSADFSDAYDWDNMLPSYDAWNPNPAEAEDAIAELMYELGIAAEANYEPGGTGANTRNLGERLEDYFFFEPCQWNASMSTLLSPMEADLRAGFPCVVSIPDHAIVADGLMVDNGTTTYHFNYGWGGSNNGWFTAAAISVEDGATSLRPRLMAFPQTNAVAAAAGIPVEVQWILPKRREDEVGKLVVYRLDSGSWQPFAEDSALLSRRYSAVETSWDDCDDFLGFEVYSTSSGKEWSISNVVDVGNCFGIMPDGYGGTKDYLTSYSTITPTASTHLRLRAKYKLFADVFRVLVSTDRYVFSEVWSRSGTVDWSDISIDLSAYAGQAVYVRLEYAIGNYYTDGGIWIDSIGTQEVTNPELEGQPIHYTVLTNLSAGLNTLAAVLVDAKLVEHGLGPAFTVDITDDGDGMPADWEILYGLDPTTDDGGLDPDGDGYSNFEEYICGTVPTNADSCWLLEAGAGNLPAFYAMEGRLYTIQYRTNLTSGSWMSLAADIPGSNGVVEIEAYDSAIHAARFYRVQVQP